MVLLKTTAKQSSGFGSRLNKDTLEGGVRLFLVIIVMLVGVSIQTSAQDAVTELEVRQAKKQYLDCLSVETARVVPRKLSQKDFVTFIKSACLNEQSLFRNALIKLFSRHRNTGQGAVYETTVDGVIAASIDDFVKSKIRP